MELTRPLFLKTATALDDLLQFKGPADASLQLFFRKNPNLGAAERKLIADAVFCVMRHYGSLAALAENVSKRILLAALVIYEPVPYRAEALKNLVGDEFFTAAQNTKNGPKPLDLPDWLLTEIATQIGDDGAAAFAAAVNTQAPLDLRVNTLLTQRDKLQAALEAEGFIAQKTAYSPFALKLSGKRSISKLELYQKGLCEIQDEGSQLLALLPEAGRHDIVADFCAGAGGKTLLMGMQMRGKSRLYAMDIDEKRLSQLAPRAARAGLSNIHTMRLKNEHDPLLKRLAGKIDKVLVDAPCSGTGTIRRNPDLKWRRQPDDIAKLAGQQASILEAASKLCKSGGRLVYATCSVLHQENEDIIENFLAAHDDFTLLPAGEILARQGINISLKNSYLRLWPQEHDSDGFFGAVLEKNG